MEDLQKQILEYLSKYIPAMNENIRRIATYGLIGSLILALGCFFILKAKKTNEPKPKNNSESSEPGT